MGVLFGYFLAVSNPHFHMKAKFAIKTFMTKNNKANSIWQKGYKKVTIISSADKKTQDAYFYSTTAKSPQPLVVSLHTWGGDYKSFDSLAILSKEKNINYIHPNFRGPNNNPEACMSKLVIADIDDAIDYAVSKGNVDISQIHIIGKSGGGLAAIGAYMKSKHQLNTVSAWVPITDLVKWYTEGLIRQNKYTKDILKCTSSIENILNIKNAKEKSPINWLTPIDKLKKTRLLLYAGVYDGTTGSVPISHSIAYYNKILRDYQVEDSTKFVSKKEELLLFQHIKTSKSLVKIGNRQVFLNKEYQKINLRIFDGGHEMLTQYAFNALFIHN